MQISRLDSLSGVLGVLTALIAPALLVSACGTFILSTSNRLAMTTERVRTLAAQLWRLKAEEALSVQTDRRVRLERHMERAFQRVLLQQRALALFYGAAVLFVACSLALGLEAVTRRLPSWLPEILGLVGVTLLLGACALLLVDIRLLVAAMRDEMAWARRRDGYTRF